MAPRIEVKVLKYQPTLALKPTQFSVGMLEIEFKFSEFKKLSAKKLAKLVTKTPVPVVISPWKELCVVDHHHFLFACWHADIREVRVDVVEDLSKSNLSYHRFWQRMAKKGYSHPFDQFGTGPRSALYLPLDIRGLADDPYRSLAWMVRKEGGYKNSNESFAEFAWANFFRSRRLLETQGRRGFHAAVRQGIRLAGSTAAKKLPGYLSPNSSSKTVTKRIVPKSTYVVSEQKKGRFATRIRCGK